MHLIVSLWVNTYHPFCRYMIESGANNVWLEYRSTIPHRTRGSVARSGVLQDAGDGECVAESGVFGDGGCSVGVIYVGSCGVIMKGELVCLGRFFFFFFF